MQQPEREAIETAVYFGPFLRPLQMSAFRCRSCRKRFYAGVPEAMEIGRAALSARMRVENSY